MVGIWAFLPSSAAVKDSSAHAPDRRPAHRAAAWRANCSATSAPRSAKCIDILATAIAYGATVEEISDLDLSYTPPLGSPWDALQQHAARAWTTAATHRPTRTP